MTADVLLIGIMTPWVVMALVGAVGAWIGGQLVRQSGRLLSRVEAVEQGIMELAASAAARAPGGPALPAMAAPAAGNGAGLPDANGSAAAEQPCACGKRPGGCGCGKQELVAARRSGR